MNKLVFSLLFALTLQIGWSQGKAELQQHFDQLAKGKKVSIDKKTMEAFRQNAAVVATLNQYLTSEQTNLQREALRLSAKIGIEHAYAVSRIQMVNQLLNAAKTMKATQLGKVSKILQQFKRADFDQKAEEQLATLIRMERPHMSKFIELAGFLQMQGLLNELLIDFKEDKYLYNSISIALTRCGDSAKRKNLLKNVAKYRINDEFIYGIVPKLVYARQKETTDYLFDIILKDQKTCTHPAHGHIGHEDSHSGHSHEHDKLNCAYRVMEAIAPYVKGIPLQVGASGDLVTSDYQQTLKTTRKWILDNRDSYELNNDIY